MKYIDPDAVRALVRRELMKRLGSMPSSSLSAKTDSMQHPSHLEVLTEPGCEEEGEFSSREPCLIEPHRLCSHSGYCKKLGY
jgi:hypothetical protein